MAKKKYRIDNADAFQMVMVALFFDTLGLVAAIPLIGTLLNWMILGAADYSFFFWFRSKKVDFFSKKNVLGIAIATLLELIFGFLPAILGQTAILILTSWSEDTLAGNTDTKKSVPQEKPGESGAEAAAQAPQVPNVPTQMPSI